MKSIEDNDLFLHRFDETPANPREFTFPDRPNGGDEDKPSRRSRWGRRLKHSLAILLILLAVGACGWAYIYYMYPASNSCYMGRFYNPERRGIIFKTNEAIMVREGVIGIDTIPVSFASDALWEQAVAHSLAGNTVTINTKGYFGTVPWRGNSTVVVTHITPNK